MGVQGLWTLVAPAARPVKLEALQDQRLAIDASIWMHQFLRSMRDKEGNAVRNGYILGFFRRLCKLLFYNIKPVFVFDGGAPALKRSTIRERRRRREEIAVNLKRTAEKILNAQIRSRLLVEEEKKRRGIEQPQDEDYVYLEELENSAAVEQLRRKRKRDQFELPPASVDASRLDPRIATEDELKSFIDEYTPSDLDIDSSTFQALPPEIQYEIIQDIKLRSRQTSWARLDEMVRNSHTALDFSKQQIKQLAHRNDMTQRLMQMNETASKSTNKPSRIAGERGREYILVKNENLDQGLGWRLPGMEIVAKETPEQEDNTPPPPPKNDKPVDRVTEAIASNPKLAALMSNLADSDQEGDDWEEEEEETREETIEEAFEETVGGHQKANNQEDEPLFLQPTEGRLVDDIRAYAYEDEDDSAIQQVIAKIYSDNNYTDTPIVTKEPSPPKEMAELSLSVDDFYQLWLSRVPDAFVYLHSLNDEYKQVLRDAIYEQDTDTLSSQLKSIQKTLGKTSDRDELAIESLSFHEQFLKSTLQWKEVHADYPVEPDVDSLGDLDEDTLLVEDDDNDIYFESGTAKPDHTNMNHQEVTPVGSIDLTDSILKSSLRSSQPDSLSSMKDDEHAMDVESTLSADVGTSVVHADPIEPSTLQELKTAPIPPLLEPSKEKKEHSVQGLLADETISLEMSEAAPDVSAKISVHSPATREATEEDAIDAEAPTENELEQAPVPPQENLGYNSDEELLDGVEEEEDEFARFVSDIASKDLHTVRQELDKDMEALNEQYRKAKSGSEDITQQMTLDIQELLRLFGVPFVVSPMEAEAQCAALLRLGLIEGVVTDDSDVFLFGATRIYKNMFNQQRYVECYMMQDVERDMRLTRQKLIQLAFLLGSDYTEGIAGVGPVTAMEILAEFGTDDEAPLEAPLEAFRDWYHGGEDRTDFERHFRKKHKHLEIPEDFPNVHVKDAYYQPTVDPSNQAFVWGKPQLDSLRVFLMQSFAWPEQKVDEILIPVIREMNKRESEKHQTTLRSYFDMSREAPVKNGPRQRRTHQSKRVQHVIHRWKGEQKEETKSGAKIKK